MLPYELRRRINNGLGRPPQRLFNSGSNSLTRIARQERASAVKRLCCRAIDAKQSSAVRRSETDPSLSLALIGANESDDASLLFPRRECEVSPKFRERWR